MQATVHAHCNRCGGSTNHNIIGERDRGHDDWFDKYEMLECCGCGTVCMRNTWGTDGLPRKHAYYPPATARRQPEWADAGLFELIGESPPVPEHIAGLFKEIYPPSKMVRTGLPLWAFGRHLKL